MTSSSYRLPHRATSRRAVARASVAVLLLSLAACQDPSRMFTGRWEAMEVVTSDWLPDGLPELAIGHFGPELTGVVWYLDENGLLGGGDGCPCSFIDHRSVNLTTRVFTATTTHCSGDVWIWRMERVDDEEELLLVGTVSDPSHTGREEVITLRLVDRFIPEERKRCD